MEQSNLHLIKVMPDSKELLAKLPDFGNVILDHGVRIQIWGDTCGRE
jgi:hypothetical protein